MAAPQVQRICGWIIVAVSLAHVGVTFIDYDRLSLSALWFVGSGFAVLLIGGLNVITSGFSRATVAELRSLRILTLVANSCGVSLGLLYAIVTGGSQPQGPVLVVLFVVAGAAQLRTRS